MMAFAQIDAGDNVIIGVRDDGLVCRKIGRRWQKIGQAPVSVPRRTTTVKPLTRADIAEILTEILNGEKPDA